MFSQLFKRMNTLLTTKTNKQANKQILSSGEATEYPVKLITISSTDTDILMHCGHTVILQNKVHF